MFCKAAHQINLFLLANPGPYAPRLLPAPPRLLKLAFSPSAEAVDQVLQDALVAIGRLRTFSKGSASFSILTHGHGAASVGRPLTAEEYAQCGRQGPINWDQEFHTAISHGKMPLLAAQAFPSSPAANAWLQDYEAGRHDKWGKKRKGKKFTFSKPAAKRVDPSLTDIIDLI